MLYTTNKDIPGIIGTLGQTMGEHEVNIANFTLGRKDIGGDAIALLYLIVLQIKMLWKVSKKLAYSKLSVL